VREALAHPAQFRLMFGPLLARKAEHPGLQRAAERAFLVLLEAAARFAPERGLEIALAGWSLSHGAAHLAIDGAFGSLPIAPAQARRLARLDAGALVRGMVAGLLQVPEPPRPRKPRRQGRPLASPRSGAASVQPPSTSRKERR
jgi:Tetracyclin repressor-like, C-terminal domain